MLSFAVETIDVNSHINCRKQKYVNFVLKYRQVEMRVLSVISLKKMTHKYAVIL